NPAEMHGSLDAAVQRLDASPRVRERLRSAFRDAPAARGDSAITAQRIRDAIAAWERSLVRLDSRFDRHVRGDTSALTPLERRGFNAFMGTGKCGTCHFAPLFGGTVPPGYQKGEFEVLGTPATARWQGARVDADPGRAGVTRVPLHQSAFKTPALRNVAVTAPYMHNGVYRTLDEVLEFYVRGGGAGIGAVLPHQTLPPDRVQLTRADRDAIIAFLGALTDTSAIVSAPRHPIEWVPTVAVVPPNRAPSSPPAPAARATAVRRESIRSAAR
nr:hypothetical protein [Gemmatimonadaceae bacterium]